MAGILAFPQFYFADIIQVSNDKICKIRVIYLTPSRLKNLKKIKSELLYNNNENFQAEVLFSSKILQTGTTCVKPKRIFKIYDFELLILTLSEGISE